MGRKAKDPEKRDSPAAHTAMIKLVLCTLTVALLVSTQPVEAKNLIPGKSQDKMPASGSSFEQRYGEVKDELDQEDKKDNPSLKEKVSQAAENLKQAILDLTRGDPKTDFDQRENRGHLDLQHGDPKTTFNQSENRMHSPRFAPQPPPDPDPTPEPTPEPEPSPEVLDLTTWTIANTYLSGTYKLSVYFQSVGDGLYDVVLVVYDTVTGDAIQATGYRTENVYEMPDRTGLTLVLVTTQADGSKVEKYGLFTEEVTQWSDVTMWVEVYYDPYGNFQYAVIKTIETIPLDTLALPSLDAIQTP